jgi:hypothetical protein
MNMVVEGLSHNEAPLFSLLCGTRHFFSIQLLNFAI